MLNNTYLIVAIIVALFTLSGMVVTSFLWINKSFRDYLEKLLKNHDDANRTWTEQLLQDYYYSLDEKITNLHYRLSSIEKKCNRIHGE